MTNEIVKKEETPLAALTPDQMPELQAPEAGDTIRIPRLMLIQDLSPARREGLAKAGEMINSLTKQNYGSEIQIVPLVQRPMTRIRWQERTQGGGLLCISRNKQKPNGDPGSEIASCDKCQHFTNYDPKTGCTNNYEIISLVVNGEDPHFWEPILIVAESTRPSDNGFRDIIGNVRFNAQRGVRMFHKGFTLKAVSTKNKMGEFFKSVCLPANGNGLLPLETIEFLEKQVSFFLQAKIDTSEAHQTEPAAAPVATEDAPW